MKICGLTKTYNGRRVLDLPEMEVRDGTICSIAGTNGSGKSTMAKILAGIEKPDGGKVPIEANVGYMPQQNFAFRMTVLKNIMLNGDDSERAKLLYERMGLTALLDKNAKTLSGGETARMALCRLLMKDYDLLILDEPTAAMDIEATAQSEALIKEYCDKTGCTVFIVSHSLQQAKRMSDEVMFLYEGRLAERCKTENLDNPQTEELKRFLEFYGV